MENQRKNEALKMEHTDGYSDSDMNQRLIISLRDMSHIMRFLYEGKGSQKRILIILNEVGNITQRELTEKLGIQPGSVSEVLAKLENAGHITRIVSKRDRRTADIILTESGKQLALKATEQRKLRHEEMFSCLSEEEKSLLLSLLETVKEDWKKRYQDVVESQDRRKHHHRCDYHQEKDKI